MVGWVRLLGRWWLDELLSWYRGLGELGLELLVIHVGLVGALLSSWVAFRLPVRIGCSFEGKQIAMEILVGFAADFAFFGADSETVVAKAAEAA